MMLSTLSIIIDFKLEREEIKFKRRITCVLNMTGHLSKSLCLLNNFFVCGVEVGVT